MTAARSRRGAGPARGCNHHRGGTSGCKGGHDRGALCLATLGQGGQQGGAERRYLVSQHLIHLLTELEERRRE